MSLLPLLLALLAAPTAIAPPSVVNGSVSGSFHVASSGAASYQISLSVPPGTNGMQPQLSIAYTSSGANGLLGIGFTLSGLKTIARTGMTVLEDGQKGGVNYDANDRFTLSGGRLINIGGTTYRTEQESWQKVVANGTCGSGPCSWTVTQPNGSVEQYTGVPAAGARFANAPYAGSMREWVLSGVTDPNGNSLTVNWTATPPQLGGGTVAGSVGVMYPSSIAYAANSGAGLAARRSVQFFYTTRTDPVLVNSGGAEALSTALLAHVQTFVTPASTAVLVSDYVLTYGQSATKRSRLTSIQQCDGKAICLPPTTFAWSSGPTGFTGASASLPNINTNQGWQGDFNGDGRTDILSSTNNVSCLATAAGGFTCGNPMNLELGQYSAVADFNGDGRADFFSGSGTVANIYYSTAAGFNATKTPVSTAYLADPLYIGDFNGDGRADIFAQGFISISTGTNFAPTPLGPFNLSLEQGQTYPGDFNGDGMADLLSAGCSSGSLYTFNGTGFDTVPLSGLSLCADTTFVADFNGDSLPDLLSSGGGQANISWNNGNGFAAATAVNDLDTSQGQSWPADFNGDGRTDIYVQTSGTGGTLYASVAPASGGNLFNKVQSSGSNDISIAGDTSFLGDFNADGLADFYNADPDTTSFYFSSTATTNQLPDLVTSIATGIGGGTSITYKPLTDPSVYTPAPPPPSHGTPPPPGTYGLETPLLASQFSYTPMSTAQVGTYPVTIGRGATYVVSSYTLANVASVNNQAYSYSYSYRYALALVNLMGRGWLGFATMTRLDPQLDARTTTLYEQSFPYTGRTLVQARCGDATSSSPCTKDDPNYLAATVQTYICTDSVANKPCVIDNSSWSPSSTQVYEVLTQQTVRDDGQWGSKSTTTYTYDQYGNRLSATHAGTTPASANTVCSSYFNDPTAWRIGFTVDQKQSSAPGCPQSWKSYAYVPATDLSWQRTTYDKRMNILSQMRWDSANNQFLGEVYGRDAYGNALTTTNMRTVPGGKPQLVPNTTQTTTYDTTFQTFAVTMTTPPANPNVSTSAQTTSTLYDPRFGTAIGQMNSNGWVQAFCLDGFGRTVAVQGPQGQTGGPVEKNCLAAITAFSVPATFSGAPVTTTSTTSWSPVAGAVVFEENALRNAWTAPSTWSVTKSTVDGLGRTVLSAAPSDTGGVNVLTQYVFLDPKRVSSNSLPYFSNASPQWTTYTYDPRGRRTSRTMPFASSAGTTSLTTWTFCGGSQLIATLNPSPAVTCAAPTPASYTAQTIVTYDQFSRGPRRISQSQTENQNALTTFQRDALGRLTTILAPASRVDGTRVATTTVLDSLSRVSSQSVTDAFDIDYTYDDEGLLEYQTDALGQKLTFTYDGLHRKLTRTAYEADGDLARTATWTYDTPVSSTYKNVNGRLSTATATDANNNVISRYVYGYDAYGRHAQSTATVNGTTYTFGSTADPQGRPSTLTYPDAAVLQTAFTPGGNLGTLTLTPNGGTATPYVKASGFNAYGAPATLQYANGVTDSRTYTPQQSMATHKITEASGDVSLNDAYDWDPLGNPLNIWDCNFTGNANQADCAGSDPTSSTNGTDQYAYTAGRLTSASGPAGSFTFAYDANGNMTSQNGATLTYDGYQLDSGTNGFAAQYDAAGNMTSRTPAGSSDTWTQTFDPEGNLTSVQRNGVLQRAYAYDGQGIRVMTTAYASDGTTVEAQTWNYGSWLQSTQARGKTTQTRLIDGAAGPMVALTGTGAAYFHDDHVQSTVRITDAAGNQTAAIDYAPYGAPKTTSGDTDDVGPLFDGRPYDAGTGLMDFQSRIYDPASGQFLSADSMLSGPVTRADTPQRYIFGWGAPASRSDPTGHQPVLDALVIELAVDLGEDLVDAMVDDEMMSATESETESDTELEDFQGDDDDADEDDDLNPQPAPVQVAPITQAEVDAVYDLYGGKAKFDKITGRVTWRAGHVAEDLEAARASAARADPLEFECETCKKVLRGDRTYQHGSRLIVDYQRDHMDLIHAHRRDLVLHMGMARYGQPVIFTREQFIDFYHQDIRLLCPPCNMGHRFEPTPLQILASTATYLTQTFQVPYWMPH
jgi:RHS repeat-associated protein